MAKRVIIIGAGGASGLAVHKELLRAKHQIVAALEATQCVGGVWCSRPEAPNTSRMYDSLRTNLPRHVMAFPSFPWPRIPSKGGDERVFPNHTEVLAYLRAYGAELAANIRFNEAAVSVVRNVPGVNGGGGSKSVAEGTADPSITSSARWTVRTSLGNIFEADALVVCNGHYHTPGWPTLAAPHAASKSCLLYTSPSPRDRG